VKERGPLPRGETVRKAISAAIDGRWLGAKDISFEVRIPEREVADHLEHLARSLRSSGGRLEIEPATCKSCGHALAPSLRRPSRCPECKSERLTAPRFRVASRRGNDA